jgi:hypothetical protein
VIAVRVLRDGACVREVLVETLPFSIGRAPGSEVLLADESVSRIHARVVEDAGSLAIEDAASRNGLHVGPRAVDRLAIEGRVRCRVGRVELELERVSDGDTQEVAAGEWRRYDQRRSGLHALGYLASAVLAWLALEVVDLDFWSPYRQRRGLELAGEALRGALSLALIALVVLVALRAMSRRVRIADALQGLARVAWLWPAAGVVTLGLYYFVSPATHAAIEVVAESLAVMLTAALLAVVRRPGPRLRYGIGWGLVALALYAGVELTQSARDAAEGSPRTRYEVQAPLAGWTGPAVESDAYFERVEAALREAERDLRAEATLP